MFKDARSFNQPLNNWNVSNVTDMGHMFQEATSFNQPINKWNVSNDEYGRYVYIKLLEITVLKRLVMANFWTKSSMVMGIPNKFIIGASCVILLIGVPERKILFSNVATDG